jgi:phosphoribosylformylglycinamidine cyclo-ligase
VSDRAPLTYAESGVSLDAADAIFDRLKRAVDSTRTPLVLGGVGGFAGLLSLSRYLDPVLAAGTDTVGSKVLLQRQTGRLHELGIDLVAMSVNDVLTCAAMPILFLDCISIGKLDPERVALLVEGVAEGCRQARCALLGGETAEMPGLYAEDDFDVAGFAVGAVERRELVGGARVEKGDAVIGLASSGAHANGFTLVRMLLDRARIDPADAPEGLLAPTRIYVAAVRAILDVCDIRAMAHVTGGGIPGNLPRVLPKGLGAEIDVRSFPRPEVFDWLAGLGVEEDELRRVFNIGLGYLLVVPAAEAERAVDRSRWAGYDAWVVGQIVEGEGVRFTGG